ncbi:hypothetical protein [Sphingobium sp. WCS2017Hpa-17]|uniref:hypothetical protein n=1 Tax=Sphingobium sp. WCS2017Hpa-17 TaxID=3073638 RepID=UPI002889A025|nr:hypothetical protein [Sphingobium sp. WCS2017Hpa-17]
MTEKSSTQAMPDVFFDIWFMPAAFWTQWWGFYAETLNVGRYCTAHELIGPDGAPVDVEVEEGLVA